MNTTTHFAQWVNIQHDDLPTGILPRQRVPRYPIRFTVPELRGDDSPVAHIVVRIGRNEIDALHPALRRFRNDLDIKAVVNKPLVRLQGSGMERVVRNGIIRSQILAIIRNMAAAFILAASRNKGKVKHRAGLGPEPGFAAGRANASFLKWTGRSATMAGPSGAAREISVRQR